MRGWVDRQLGTPFDYSRVPRPCTRRTRTDARRLTSIGGGDHTVASCDDITQPAVLCALDPGPWLGFYERGSSVILPPTNWFLYYTRRGHYYGFWTPVGHETAFPPNRNTRFTPRLGGELLACTRGFMTCDWNISGSSSGCTCRFTLSS